MTTARDRSAPDEAPRTGAPVDVSADRPPGAAADEPLSAAQANRIIEEFESESPTRQFGGAWRWIAGVLAAGLAVYALYWTQFGIPTVVYRASFLLLALVLTFLLYPSFRRGGRAALAFDCAMAVLTAGALGYLAMRYARYQTGGVWDEQTLRIGAALLALPLAYIFFPRLGHERGRAAFLGLAALIGAGLAALVMAIAVRQSAAMALFEVYWSGLAVLAVAFTALAYFALRRNRHDLAYQDIGLIVLSVASLTFLIFNYQAALQRIINPTDMEVLLGGILIALVLEATRRSTGWALPITAFLFLLYARFGEQMPGRFDHRDYSVERIIGQNFLTLEGLFGVPLDVAATFIVLFTIYGAVLEYSGAGKFFIDWSFAALGKSGSATGPGRTVTAAGFLLGTVSGSGVATTVTLGSLAWPMLRRAGYRRETAGGLLSAAGIGATLSPPTLGAAAFIIAEYLDVPYLRVLIYATIPTILYYLSCLLMIEADSRRQGTRAIEVETPSLRELTLKYGYHFSSLFAIVILMGAFGMTAFLAVFWSIAIAFALSFIRPENRLTSLWALGAGAAAAVALALTGQRLSTAAFWGMMLAAGVSALLALARLARNRSVAAATPPAAAEMGVTAGDDNAPGAEHSRFLRALEAGGRGVVSIAATTATAGVIVSVVTLTGLGLKLSGQIVDLANGNKFLTILFAAIAVWILGLAVPVTASYIIAAVMIVPALSDPTVGVGIPAVAAHMFIFYYAVLADVSPPTALAPFAAAAITGGNPFRTTMLAWKYCLPAFLVPFMFTLSPEGLSLLMEGPPLTIAWTFFTGCVAIALLAVALGGWFIRAANPLERLLAGVAGLALLFADPRADLAGFALLAVVVALHLLRLRAGAAPAGAGAD